MRIKSLTLYSFPYIVSVASLLVAVQQVTPSLGTALGKTEIISGQIVNRSLKSDRLPIKQAAPQANDKMPVKVPAQIAPDPKAKIDCKLPIDVPGRCFAGAVTATA